MTDVLDQEISGAPVMVKLCGTERPLRYTMYAIALYKRLTGDSLFVGESFQKIELVSDPDRWLKCFWAGLHQQQSDGSWKAPLTLDELGAIVDFSNAGDLSVPMAKALAQSMPKPKKVQPPPSAEGTAPISQE